MNVLTWFFKDATFQQKSLICIGIVVVIAIIVSAATPSLSSKFDAYENMQVQSSLNISPEIGSLRDCMKKCLDLSECVGFDFDSKNGDCHYAGGRVGSTPLVLPLRDITPGRITAYVRKT